ncbi:MAG: NADH-quinone oxidoreductase subunit A [Pirellulales bacterium]
MLTPLLSILLFTALALALAVGLLVAGRLIGPRRKGQVKGMPYESGMDPIHDARRRFDVRFYLVAVAFLIFDVELLFLYPWAVASRSPQGIDQAVASHSIAGRGMVFAGVGLFFLLLVLGFLYDWKKGIFKWR